MTILRITAALLALASSAALAAPRTWTSADGRTIEAEYLGRAPDGSSLVLARVDTKARVTVPLAALSAEDQAHAATLVATLAPEDEATAAAKLTEKLAAMAKAYPRPPENKHADFADIVRRYDFTLRALGSGDIAGNCRTLRVKIERDLPIVRESLSITPKSGETMDRRLEKLAKNRAAQQAVAWLEALDKHAATIEAAAEK